MTKRMKRVLLLVIVGCVIAGLILYMNNKPKNVFEEMYYAEMKAAEQGQATPLADTKYFDQINGSITRLGENSKTKLVEEAPRETSQYTLSIMHRALEPLRKVAGEERYDLEEKSVIITSEFVLRGVRIQTKYKYILFKYDNLLAVPETPNAGELYMFFADTVVKDRNVTFEYFEQYGITEVELKECMEESLNHILNYWVENYQDTTFKNNEFGEYKIDWSNRGRVRERWMKN